MNLWMYVGIDVECKWKDSEQTAALSASLLRGLQIADGNDECWT